MAIAIIIPRLGWNMDEGSFAGWLKHDGDAVLAGDPLFTVESEKATQDIEAIDQGILRIPPQGPSVGDRLAVGAVIGYLVEPNEVAPFEVPAREPKRTTDDRGTMSEQRRVVETQVIGLPDDGPSAIRRQTSDVAERTLDVGHSPVAIGPSYPRCESKRPASSPLARRLARELGVDWSSLRGSGRTGRIRKADVLAAAARGDRAKAVPSGNAAARVRSIPLSPTRWAIASRLVESLQSSAQVTLTTTVDATNLVNLRAQFKAAALEEHAAPSYTDFVVKLTAIALCNHPALNSVYYDNAITIYSDINIAIAIDTELGLFAPVIRNVESLGLRQVAERSIELIRRARGQQLRPVDMQEATFTLTNLGAFGVETFTPIINPPGCAILGIGRIERRPMFVGEQVVGRERMSLSLTFDHRVVDGAPAARFLQNLGRLIENPGPWLMS
jgi:pyruvate dehydrogenase E2 component (dihydrolipoamide acetyltransferase)